MDRQSVIEEKRQRLKQLKERRYGTSGDLVDQLVKKHTEKLLKDVAIQVGDTTTGGGITATAIDNDATIDAEVGVSPDLTELECTRFDKGIQAVPILPDPPKPTELKKSKKAINLKVEPEKQISRYDAIKTRDVSSTPLSNVSLRQFNRKITKVLFSRSLPLFLVVYAPNPDFVGDIPSFSRMNGVSGDQHGGSESSGEPDQAVSSSLGFSPGLCVIYSTGTKITPEFYISCSSPITSIIFDEIDHYKVIAGMSDGRICIWNLKESKDGLESLPVLVSPMISSITSSPFDIHQHVLPIVALFQTTADGNNSIISVSLDGIINVWSTNLLALPKQDSIKILDPNSPDLSRFRENLRMNQVIELTNENYFASNSHSHNEFLNNFIVVNEGGKISKLSNDKSKKYIDFIENVEKDNIITDGVITLKSLLETYILTSNYDWHLRLWDINSKKYTINIPTTSLIFLLAVRPKNAFQFITVGVDNVSKSSIIQYWNLNKKLFASIYTIPHDYTNLVTSIEFSPSGNSIILGFEDGEIVQLGVDSIGLDEQTKKFQSTEDGIQNYFSKLQ